MSCPPDLAERFQAPNGWRTGYFTNHDTGRRLHYGFVAPECPKAAIVCLGGLSEFSEKYYEFARDMVARDCSVWFMDWAYQGRSVRHARRPQRRHSDGFDRDVSDFAGFVSGIVRPKTSKETPLVLVGHSFGGHIGLRFLATHPGIVSAAAFSAPFVGIYGFTPGLRAVAGIARRLRPLIGGCYVFGGRDWEPSNRGYPMKNIFSSDPVRNSVHDAWLIACPEMRVGAVTFGWVTDALQSCEVICSPKPLAKIDIPVLVAIAGDERIVDNDATRRVLTALPQADQLELPGAKHEILMENDLYRVTFLEGLDRMIAKAVAASR